MGEKKIAVIAVGGNSLIRDKAHASIPDQAAAASQSMKSIAGMIASGWEVVITHGNGPQVGFILRRAELALGELHPVPLDYCGADTQGAIGYMFQQALYNEFKARGIDKLAAAVVTQTLVDRKDKAFENPTKPIGTFMDEAVALKHRDEDGWAVVEDAGRGWRRVVPSPLPQRIIEADAIGKLIEAGYVVISTGGGGIPVIENEDGTLKGVEAVIDKDFGASILATSLGAELFLITTAVEKVALNFNKPNEKWIDRMTLAEAKQYLEEGHFAKGSMEPKMRAIIKYLENGGKAALITDPDNVENALNGKTGTWIVR
ncbi:MAG: carbamate kinase [Anaerolineales bacterium]|nr:carbamate kinase [Anaerolineales bacterium]